MSDPESLDGSSDEFAAAVDDALSQITRDNSDHPGTDDADQQDGSRSMDDFGNQEGGQLAGAEPFQNGEVVRHIAGLVLEAIDDDGQHAFEQDKDSDNDMQTAGRWKPQKHDSCDDSLLDEIRYQDDEISANEGSRDGIHQAIDEELDLSAHLTRLEVAIPALPKDSRDEYSTVYSDIIDSVFEYNPSLESCKVEFTDGRIETVSPNANLQFDLLCTNMRLNSARPRTIPSFASSLLTQFSLFTLPATTYTPHTQLQQAFLLPLAFPLHSCPLILLNPVTMQSCPCFSFLHSTN